MIDLNDLRVFAYVASLNSFSLAADALNIHKSSVSRSIARLEFLLDASLLARTTRKIELTQRGIALKAHCMAVLARINEAIGIAGGFDAATRVPAAVLIESDIALVHRVRMPRPARYLPHRSTMAT
ncbi:LysR family transcriptional regulator [Variovorax rhizosphaerae]|uniref:LysR family transcriptional regulator n=1 Tax=Variovorax rhizosphaerae TaxID=1836200 RepID=A0ABU8WUH8_9BURK